MLLTIVITPAAEYLYVDGQYTDRSRHFIPQELLGYTLGSIDFETEYIHYHQNLNEIPDRIENLPM